MNYGMFIMPFHDVAKPPAQCYDEDLELVVLAEEMGFCEFWVGEHHTHQWENIALPEAFIGKALAMTDRIRLGTAPTCLPYHHPAHVATRLAFLDHLSHGRLNLCFGPGSVYPDMELFGIDDPTKNSAMFEEAAEIILQLWTQDTPYRYDGDFWQIGLEKWVDRESCLGILQRPLQRPHPPICAPGMSMHSGTMKFAGRKGWAPISANLSPGNVVADNWKVYEGAAREAGHTPDREDWRVCRSIFVGDDPDEARRRAWTGCLGRFFDFLGSVLDKGAGPGRKFFKRDPDMPDAACGRDYFLQEQIIHGDVDGVVRRLEALRQETGDFGTLILMGYDWKDAEDKSAWLRSMELFVNEVIPAMNR